jgi:hypothetical protein
MGNMKTHLALHSGAKPFICPAPDCQRAFSQLGNLKSHQKKLHPDLPLAPLIMPPTPPVTEGDMVAPVPVLPAGSARKRVARARSASSPALPTLSSPVAHTGRVRSHSKGSCDSAPTASISDWLSLMEVVVEEATPLPVPECLEGGMEVEMDGSDGGYFPVHRDDRLPSPEEIILARMKRVIGRH